MAYREPAFTLGIEEEYLLVDRASRDLVREPPPELLAECEALLQSQVMPEFLRSQIEVGTRVWLMLPGRERANAVVRWTAGDRLGAEFAEPISIEGLKD